MRRFIYPAPYWQEPAGSAPVDIGGPVPTFVLHRPAPSGAPTVVYLHGNGSDLGTIAPLAHPFVDEGMGFAAIEYPGYGPAGDQRTTEEGVMAAARRGLAHLAHDDPARPLPEGVAHQVPHGDRAGAIGVFHAGFVRQNVRHLQS